MIVGTSDTFDQAQPGRLSLPAGARRPRHDGRRERAHAAPVANPARIQWCELMKSVPPCGRHADDRDDLQAQVRPRTQIFFT